MNWVQPLVLLLATWVVAFAQAWFAGPHLGVNVRFDFLPALVVYAALNTGFGTTLAVAVLAGLGFDALSSGPFGLAVLPLAGLGAVLHGRREVLLRDSAWAQAALGGAATFAVTLASFLLLVVLWPLLSGWSTEPAYWPERRFGVTALPEVGLGFFWQLAVGALGGALATPAVFGMFRLANRLFTYQTAPPPPRWGEREMRRGRV